MFPSYCDSLLLVIQQIFLVNLVKIERDGIVSAASVIAFGARQRAGGGTSCLKEEDEWIPLMLGLFWFSRVCQKTSQWGMTHSV